MVSSKTSIEWDQNADKVKEFFGGYPSWWFDQIVKSGLLALTKAKAIDWYQGF